MITEMDTSSTNFHLLIVANSTTRVQCAGRASPDRTQPKTQQTGTSLLPLHRLHPHQLHQMPAHLAMRTVPATRKYSPSSSPLSRQHLHIRKTQALFPTERLCKVVSASQEGLKLEIIYSTSFFLSCCMDKTLLLLQSFWRGRHEQYWRRIQLCSLRCNWDQGTA